MIKRWYWSKSEIQTNKCKTNRHWYGKKRNDKKKNNHPNNSAKNKYRKLKTATLTPHRIGVISGAPKGQANPAPHSTILYHIKEY